MPNSYNQPAEIDCPKCGEHFVAEIWLIVDVMERPDLLEQILKGNLHEVVCPKCVSPGQVGAPLLVFRQNADPYILFSPAHGSGTEQNPQQAGALVRKLRESLGPGWQDIWLANGLPTIERVVLHLLLSESLETELQKLRDQFEAKVERLRNKDAGVFEKHVQQVKRKVGQVPLLQMVQEFNGARTWFDAQKIVEQYPELLSEEAILLFEKLSNIIHEENDNNAPNFYKERLSLLKLCREVGIHQAFKRKVGLPTDQIEAIKQLSQIIPEAREVLEELILQGEDISSLENLQRALDAHPYLRKKFEKATELEQRDLHVSPELIEYLRKAQEEMQHYLQTSNLDVLNQATNAWQRILNHVSFAYAPQEFQLAIMNDAANVYFLRFQNAGAIDDLDFALDLWRQALTNRPLDSPQRAGNLNNVGIGLHNRYKRTGRKEDLEKAILSWRQAVTSTPTDSLALPRYLDNLGQGLHDYYECTGRLEDLEEAIRIFDQAVSSTLVDSPDRPIYLNSLSISLHKYYRHTGQQKNLEEAIRIWREVVANTPEESSGRLGSLNNLSSGLLDRFYLTGNREDLEEAIRIGRHVELKTPENSPDRPSILATLGNVMVAFYDKTGRLEDLEEVINIYRQAKASTPLDSPDMPSCQNSLGNALTILYQRTGILESLDEAIRECEQAVVNTPLNSLYRPMYLNNLGQAFNLRYERTGRLEDVEEAIRMHEQAVATTPDDSPQKPTRLNNLGTDLRERYKRTGQLSDLEETIRVCKLAVEATSKYSHELPLYLGNLATSLRVRYEYTRSFEDLEDSKRYYQESCELAQTRSEEMVLTCSRVWGDWAFRRQAWEETNEAYRYSINAIQSLYKAQFSRPSKEAWLRDTRGISVRAAYSLAKNGDLSVALETIESGRARQLGEALERARRDMQLLATNGHQDLLERYSGASARYNSLTQKMLQNGMLEENPPLLLRNLIEQLEIIQREIDNIISEVRQIKGYETFLLSPTFMQIQQQAEEAPLVYLIATTVGGLALIVTAQNIYSVELPTLTDDSLLKQVIGKDGQSNYLSTYLEWWTDPYNDIKRETWKEALDQTTRWLWDTTMQPVIAKLKTILPPGRRVILILSDLLSLLPMHAAWVPDETRPCKRLYALDEFTFTYAPSALALMRSQQQAREMPLEKLLVIENPDHSLRFSGPAAQAALALFNQKTHLLGNAATFDAVREAFNDHNVLYFFTHGIARFDAPLKSALTLADRPFTLNDIFSLQTGHARLAVLSACETGVTSNLALLDEVVSLPSGLIQAGVPGVVGSLWVVVEASTAILMNVFFEQWRKVGLSAPEALRKAQMIVRDAAHNKEAQNYFKKSVTAGTTLPAMDNLHKELLIKDFDHPFYWAAFTYTGL